MINVRLQWVASGLLWLFSSGVNGNTQPPASGIWAWQGLEQRSTHDVSAPLEEEDLSGEETILAQVDEQAHFMHYNQAPKPLWGLPKIVWVIVADVLAMTVFLTCIPVVLSCAKRRRPIFR